MHRLHIICVHHGLIPLYICMSCRRAICVLILLATLYVSSNYFVCICVSYRRARARSSTRRRPRAKRYICLHTAIPTGCVLILLYTGARAQEAGGGGRAKAKIYTYVRIILYLLDMCPHAATYRRAHARGRSKRWPRAIYIYIHMSAYYYTY
jgi:hypothetical protein